MNPSTGVKLSLTSRPAAVAAWIARARKPTWEPMIDVETYPSQFTSWWSAMQPSNRKLKKDMFVAHGRDGVYDWSTVRIFGPNGIASVIAALAWWQKTVNALSTSERIQEQLRLDEAMDEVLFTLA
jgi:hypothetical protein